MFNNRLYLMQLAAVLVAIAALVVLLAYAFFSWVGAPIPWDLVFYEWAFVSLLAGGLLTWETYHELFEYWWFCLWYHEEDDD